MGLGHQGCSLHRAKGNEIVRTAIYARMSTDRWREQDREKESVREPGLNLDAVENRTHVAAILLELIPRRRIGRTSAWRLLYPREVDGEFLVRERLSFVEGRPNDAAFGKIREDDFVLGRTSAVDQREVASDGSTPFTLPVNKGPVAQNKGLII